jgi:hypothetical protein
VIAAPRLAWAEANQRYLDACLRRLRVRLEPGAGAFASPEAGEAQSIAAAMDSPPTLQVLQRAFGLTDFERDLLLLCAGVDLDSGFAAAVAGAQGDGVSRMPTPGLALAVLDGPHWSALSPASPLRHWRLLELGDGPSLTRSPLRVDERVLQFLTGIDFLDPRLSPLVALLAPATAPAPSHAGLARELTRAWRQDRGPRPPVCQLLSNVRADAIAVAAAAARGAGLVPALLLAGDIPGAAREQEELARLWEREAALGSLVLVLDCLDRDGPAAGEPNRERALVSRFVELVASPVVLLTETLLDLHGRPDFHLRVEPPSSEERLRLWQAALSGRLPEDGLGLERVAGQFVMSAGAIEGVAGELSLLGADATTSDAGALLWRLCRERTRPRVEHLAQRVEPVARFVDLILPETQKQVLRHIAAHVRHRARVYERWGFASKSRRGLGIGALFSGPSGTGKTMAAEVLAGELGLDLYRIDLSQVVSKYIGETEKNLARLFDAAGPSAVLFFDEADALFGKRTEVRDSHDRYANIEVSYLLQRMEAFEGLAVLATNLKSALDSAFTRRIRFMVQFPFPDAAARAEIWRSVFPSETPVEALDWEKLARLNVTGGSIRNIALHAAFLAAEEDGMVGMGQLLEAARIEFLKLERPLSEAEIRGWL